MFGVDEIPSLPRVLTFLELCRAVGRGNRDAPPGTFCQELFGREPCHERGAPFVDEVVVRFSIAQDLVLGIHQHRVLGPGHQLRPRARAGERQHGPAVLCPVVLARADPSSVRAPRAYVLGAREPDQRQVLVGRHFLQRHLHGLPGARLVPLTKRDQGRERGM